MQSKLLATAVLGVQLLVIGLFVIGVSKAEYRGDALPEKANVQNG